MPGDRKYPISSQNIVTAFNGAKAVLTIPELCNEVEIIVTGLDVWVALRDTATNTGTSDPKNVANLDTNPNTIAMLAVAGMTVPYRLPVPAGKPMRARQDASQTPIRVRGYLHYKPTGASGAGRLIVNYYQ